MVLMIVCQSEPNVLTLMEISLKSDIFIRKILEKMLISYALAIALNYGFYYGSK